jgi:hypothetical protein
MKAVCSNCKATLGCSCQRRMASNGAQVCANCIINYELSLNSVPAQPATTVLYTKPTDTSENKIDTL